MRCRRWSRLHVLRCDFRQLHRHTTGASVAHGGAGGLIAHDDSRDCGRRPTAAAATCVLHAGDIAVAETSRLRACVIHAECDPKGRLRTEEHTSELQSLMRSSYAVYCLKK